LRDIHPDLGGTLPHDKALEAIPILGEEVALSKVKRKPVFWDLTIHTAVMRPATGECFFANHDRA
jgi:hypothetical protein